MNNNPLGTQGFAFLEFAAADPQFLQQRFNKLGFLHVADHSNTPTQLFRQGDINFLVNTTPQSKAEQFAHAHGPSCCAMGFLVKDAEFAHKEALQRGAKDFTDSYSDYHLPAIEGIGGSAIYFVDDNYQLDQHFVFFADRTVNGAGLQIIDHVTHNVHRGEMDKWYEFYHNIFNFEQTRYFDIQGQQTGLISRALASPCGNIRIPINEATDDKSQIEEFIRDFNGEGIQHIALSTQNVYVSTEKLRSDNVVFLDVPDSYYGMIQGRLPWHKEDLARLQRNKILIDGDSDAAGGLLLQIFTENTLGPVFFEVIQRKGNQGFGEGNFQALFEAIERDQMARGVL